MQVDNAYCASIARVSGGAPSHRPAGPPPSPRACPTPGGCPPSPSPSPRSRVRWPARSAPPRLPDALLISGTGTGWRQQPASLPVVSSHGAVLRGRMLAFPSIVERKEELGRPWPDALLAGRIMPGRDRTGPDRLRPGRQTLGR